MIPGVKVLIGVTAVFWGWGSGLRNLHRGLIWTTTHILSATGIQCVSYFFNKIATCERVKCLTFYLLPPMTNYCVLARQLMLLICSDLSQQTVFSARVRSQRQNGGGVMAEIRLGSYNSQLGLPWLSMGTGTSLTPAKLEIPQREETL